MTPTHQRLSAAELTRAREYQCGYERRLMCLMRWYKCRLSRLDHAIAIGRVKKMMDRSIKVQP